MKLRQKTLLLVSSTLIGFQCLIYLLIWQLFLSPVQRWQEQKVKQEMVRVLETIDHELADLKRLVDNSLSSEIPFSQTAKHQGFDLLVSSGSLDLLLWQDAANIVKVKYGVNSSYNLAPGGVDSFFEEHPEFQEIWQNVDSEMPVAGLINTSSGLFLIAGRSSIASPRLPNRTPMILLAGRHLEPTSRLALSSAEELSLTFHNLKRGELPPKFHELRPWLKQATSQPWQGSDTLAKSAPMILFPESSHNFSTGYTVLPDIYGQPLLLLELQMKADPNHLWMGSRQLIWLLLTVAVGFNLAILILLDKILLQKLTKLSQSVGEIAQTITTDHGHQIEASIAHPKDLSAIENILAKIHSELNQIKQERHKLDACHQAIADYATCLISRHSLEGKFLYVSPASRQLLGYEPDELIGKSLDRLVHPEDLPEIKTSSLTIQHRPVALTFSHRCQRKDGDYIWLETRSKIIRDPQNHDVLEVFWISHDITERQQTESRLEQHEESIRQLYKITSSSQLNFDQKVQRLLFIGRQYFDLEFGILSQIEENQYKVIAAQSYKQQIAPGTVFELNQTYCKKTYQAQTIVYFESLMVSRWHSESIESPLGQQAYMGIPVMVNGEIYGTLSFFSSEPRQVPFKSQDQELLQLMAQWIGNESERIQSAEKLARTRDEAIAATRAKSEFLATMSHEIRTPMNAVIGMTSLLLDTPLTSEQKDFIETIRHSGDALLTIINDILDFSKIEAGKIELERQPFNLHEAIEGALDLLANKANEKKIELAYVTTKFIPNTIVGDLTRVRQILINILSNAIKFTEKGEVILTVFSRKIKSNQISDCNDELSLKVVEPKNQKQYEIIFSIQDTGIGIPEDRMSRLFKSFSQVNASTTRQYGGTGLGLAISKSLSEMMGGRMWVVSGSGIAGDPPKNWQEIEEISQSLLRPVSLNAHQQTSTIAEETQKTGSNFYFTIVTEEIPSSSMWQLPPGDENYLANKRLLVVDDNQTLLNILRNTSQSWGMIVETANSPTEGLSRLRTQEPFDIVIVDMEMPEIDGMAMADEIRSVSNTDQVPLVMMIPLGTKVKDPNEFTAFLNKPIKKSQLFNVLSAIFGRQPLSSRAVEVPVNSSLQPQVELAPLKILLAEDHLVNQKVALQMLERMGYQADIANNGLEAIASLHEKTYDVVLMDVQMPELNGLEAAEKICAEVKAGTLSYKPRIIAMTANAMIGDREACLAAGMDDYISKPIRMIELSQALSLCEPLDPNRQKIQPNSPAASLPALISSTPSTKELPQNQQNIEPLLDANILNSFREIDSLEEVVEIYLVESPKLLQKMSEAIANDDPAKLRDAAHSLKSTSAALGANTLAQLSKTLEEMIRRGKTTEAPTLIAKIEIEYRLVKAALELEIHSS